MQISDKYVKELVKLITELGFKDNQTNKDQTVFIMDDLTAVFRKNGSNKHVFYGLVFDVLGREFVVTDKFEILINGIDPATAERITYEVMDEEFVEKLNIFIKWRLEILDTLAI